MSAQDTLMERLMAADGGALAAGMAAKLAPAAVGAFIMVAVGPKTITRREVVLRAFVGLSVSYLFGDAATSYVGSLGLDWFIATKHRSAVDGLLGCVGWGLMGGLSVISQRFKTNPLETVRDVRETITGGKP